jgi:hypothetical protein
MKTAEDHFRDWESCTFGYGYGSGEHHILAAVKKFLALCNEGNSANSYDYMVLEKELTPVVAWLLINIFARDGVEIIEYGTSPRYGYLTDEGDHLKEFFGQHSVDELYSITGGDADYMYCQPSFCNCTGHHCHNPFWKDPVNLDWTK